MRLGHNPIALCLLLPHIVLERKQLAGSLELAVPRTMASEHRHACAATSRRRIATASGTSAVPQAREAVYLATAAVKQNQTSAWNDWSIPCFGVGKCLRLKQLAVSGMRNIFSDNV